MKLIPLTRGQSAIVDDEDYCWLTAYSWSLSSKGYAVRSQWKPNRKMGTYKMHREILGADSGVQVDHINGNRLDNRRSNLRLATPSQNRANGKTHINNALGIKGVRYIGYGKYRARIRVNYKLIHLGCFTSADAAHEAYVAAAKQHFGEFARAS